MRNCFVIRALAVSASGAGAIAQDSTSVAPGGDALPIGDTDLQTVSYVLDLAVVESSWGNRFGVGPLLKASTSSTDGRPAEFGNTAIGDDLRRPPAYASPLYASWSAPGVGVNPAANTPPVLVLPPNAAPSRLVVAAQEFGPSDQFLTVDRVIAATVEYNPADPLRLYVTRELAGVGADGVRLSLGGVDAAGNLAVTTGADLLRVRLGELAPGQLNEIAPGAGTAATDTLLADSAVPFAPPALLPESATQDGGVLVAAAFDGSVIRAGSAGGVTAGADHYASAGAPSLQRGSARAIAGGVLSGAAGSLAVLRPGNAAVGLPREINIWDADADGTPVAAVSVPLPASLVGPTGPLPLPSFASGFLHYRGLPTLRGGTPVAIGSTRSGEPIAAATVSIGVDLDTAAPAVAAVTLAPTGPRWSLVAADGTPVLDGPRGAAVGRVEMGAPLGGPAISSPALDGGGNVWFVAPVFTGEGPAAIADTLIRAVRNAEGRFELESVLAVGDEIFGEDSRTPYRIDSLVVRAPGGGIAPAAFGAASARSGAYEDAEAGSLPPGDTAALGGAIVTAKISYLAEPPQQTPAVLYLGFAGTPPCSPIDLGLPFGLLNFQDIATFTSLLLASDPDADINDDGLFGFPDVALFIDLFNEGCP